MSLRQMFDVELNVKDLFTYPTIATLSQFIEAKKNDATDIIDKIPTASLNLMSEVEVHEPQGLVK